MFYIVDIYTYYECSGELVHDVNILAMAETINEICKMAKIIDEQKKYSRYFQYCHNVNIYKADGLIAPHEFIKMDRYMCFSNYEKYIK